MAMIKKFIKVLSIVVLGVAAYILLVGTRVVCKDFGPLDTDTITERNGTAYIKGTNTLFSGRVRDSGCGRECESFFICPDPPELLVYSEGKLLRREKRW
jgi:hypothetical protein